MAHGVGGKELKLLAIEEEIANLQLELFKMDGPGLGVSLPSLPKLFRRGVAVSAGQIIARFTSEVLKPAVARRDGVSYEDVVYNIVSDGLFNNKARDTPINIWSLKKDGAIIGYILLYGENSASYFICRCPHDGYKIDLTTKSRTPVWSDFKNPVTEVDVGALAGHIETLLTPPK